MAYTKICYETAYLAYHYPAEYYCACISNAKDSAESAGFISTLRRRGIPVLNTMINESQKTYLPKEDGVVLSGFKGLKYFGDGNIDKLIEERRTNGKFKSMEDFCTRVPKTVINKTALKSLICAGAFELLEGDKKSLYERMSIKEDWELHHKELMQNQSCYSSFLIK